MPRRPRLTTQPELPGLEQPMPEGHRWRCHDQWHVCRAGGPSWSLCGRVQLAETDERRRQVLGPFPRPNECPDCHGAAARALHEQERQAAAAAVANGGRGPTVGTFEGFAR